VEPLSLVQQEIRRLAWLPAFRIKRRVLKYLQQKDRIDFENDYDTFYIEGESKSREVGKPLLLNGVSKEVGVLLVHGYMSAPPEVEELANYLSRRGVWVYCPRLKGHGTSPEDLAARTFYDWIESVDTGYAIVRHMCSRVVVGGFSTGGALVLDLAARLSVNGEDTTDSCLKGVFAVCPPLRLQDLGAKFAPAVDVWNRIMKKVRLGSISKEFIENHPENPHINYFRNPISGIKEIEELADELEPRLPLIQLPALVVQSFRDPVVNYKGSRRIFQLLGSEDKQYVLFNFARHGILLGEGANRVYETIWNFIKYL
jgi:esterase/lipase